MYDTAQIRTSVLCWIFVINVIIPNRVIIHPHFFISSHWSITHSLLYFTLYLYLYLRLFFSILFYCGRASDSEVQNSSHKGFLWNNLPRRDTNSPHSLLPQLASSTHTLPLYLSPIHIFAVKTLPKPTPMIIVTTMEPSRILPPSVGQNFGYLEPRVV